ncbi:MAG: polymer-forming cytoskeletal protein [Gammaproteobacteria bacterium]|nr:polymer-forming cytoskeletal protein [Gammaproteobacteria bacterium]
MRKTKQCVKAQHDKIKATQHMDTLVGPNTTIRGNIDFTSGMHVDGTVYGDVSCESDTISLLVVGNSAKIVGDVKVQRAVVNGYISGNLYVYDHLELGEKAVILGDVHYNLLEMAVGSEIRGALIPDIKKSPHSLLEDHSKLNKPEDQAELSKESCLAESE